MIATVSCDLQLLNVQTQGLNVKKFSPEKLLQSFCRACDISIDATVAEKRQRVSPWSLGHKAPCFESWCRASRRQLTQIIGSLHGTNLFQADWSLKDECSNFCLGHSQPGRLIQVGLIDFTAISESLSTAVMGEIEGCGPDQTRCIWIDIVENWTTQAASDKGTVLRTKSTGSISSDYETQLKSARKG